MLAADPSTGAFRSLGLGLAQFSEDEKERREKQKELDKQVALKAFELAKQDEDAALKYLQEYDLAVAKERGSLTYHMVTDPNLTLGVGDQAQTFEQGEMVGLTKDELFANRFKVGPEITGGTKTFKNTQRGQLVSYMSAADAEKTVLGLGLSKDNPNFDDVVKQITAKTELQVGQPVVVAGAYAELSPLVRGDEVFNIMLSPSENAPAPLFQEYAKTRSISYALAPKMRPKGSGSTSDMEFKAYQKAILSLSNLTDANYINLYAFKKMIQNSAMLNDKEAELLTGGQIANVGQLNNELKAIDFGIFEKIPAEITAESLQTTEGKRAANDYLNGLPDGAVIDNSKNIFPGPTFLIKRPGALIVNPDEGF